jgi:hypothetical protein
MRRRRCSPALIAAALILAGLFGVGAGLGQLSGVPGLPSFGLAHSNPTTPAARAMARSTPTKISIPTIGVYAPITSVGVAADGSIATPPLDDNNLAGWYRPGPSPGQNGPAIIVGHVDGPRGESVFYQLSKLKPGAKVQVNLANHRIALFSVYSVEHYPKGKLPSTKVYGDYTRPALRLITCGGRYMGGSEGYEDNVVVYASLLARG